MIINSFLFASAPSYPASLKLFIDAGNPLSYSGSGTTVTDLIGTQNGTLTNGVGYSSSNGGYFTFDGVNDFIDFGINTAIRPLSARTVSVWVYIDPTYNVSYFYSDGNDLLGTNGVALWYDSAGYRSVLENASSYQVGVNLNVNSKGVWYYISTSFNGSIFKTYVNGTLRNTYTQTIIPTNSVYPTIIGGGNAISSYLKGNVSQLKIYNTQLTDAEVLTDFNEFKSRYGY